MEIIFDNFDVASPVNFATAVHSIAKKARGLPGPEQRRITRGTAFRELVSGAARLADEMKPRDLSNVMWALGALRYAPDASAKSIVSVATSRVDDFNTRDLSTALWAVG